MNFITIFGMLALANFLGVETAGALDYNLRIIPSNPPAGAPFIVAFDSDECEEWILVPDAEPPRVTVQGNLVRLEVDRITVANCSNLPSTNTLSVPALAAGNYELKLIARAYQSPGNDIFAEGMSFQVGPAIASTVTVPVDNTVALAMLVGLVSGLGYMLRKVRR